MRIGFEPEEIKALAAELSKYLSLNPAPQTPRQEVFDMAGVAEYLSVEKKWIYSMVSDGKIPYTKVGGHNRFRKSDIDKWLERHTFKP